VGGYKFCIGVDANGYGIGHGEAINVNVWSLPGEFDNQLKWPASAEFTLELENQKEGNNISHTVAVKWNKPVIEKPIRTFTRLINGFVTHDQLRTFWNNDSLSFYLSKVLLL